MSEKKPDLHYDYLDNEDESWLWIAELIEPGLPEPHCYSLVFDVRGQEATSLIQVFDSLSSVEAQEYAKKLAYS